MTLYSHCEARITGDINETRDAIRQCMWAVPADMARAQLLASKLIGLKIAAGEIAVKLRPVPREVERLAA